MHTYELDEKTVTEYWLWTFVQISRQSWEREREKEQQMRVTAVQLSWDHIQLIDNFVPFRRAFTLCLDSNFKLFRRICDQVAWYFNQLACLSLTTNLYWLVLC